MFATNRLVFENKRFSQYGLPTPRIRSAGDYSFGLQGDKINIESFQCDFDLKERLCVLNEGNEGSKVGYFYIGF